MSTETDLGPPLGSLTLAPPSLTVDQISAALLGGSRMWPGPTIDYSLPTSASSWPGYEAGKEPSVGFIGLNDVQVAQFRMAIATWDRLIAPRLVETDDFSSPGAIRIAFSAFADLTKIAGYAMAPPAAGSAATPPQGDIWISSSSVGHDFRTGSGDYLTFVHELGHALGLKHPFEGAGTLPAEFDTNRYTVMSYSAPTELVQIFYEVAGGNSFQGRYSPVYPSTPMLLDVAAIQRIYGADPDTATGNDRYAFSSFDGFYTTLYDAGGIDLIDLSNQTRGSDIDLTPGSYSSIAPLSASAQLSSLISRFPSAAFYLRDLFAQVPTLYPGAGIYTGTNNLAIAFNTIIENANGGSGADTITGNDAPNALSGGAGADYIRGLNGDDLVFGDDGADDVNGNQGFDIVRGGEGADLVRGGQGVDTVYGDAGDDPHVNGNLGDDWVFGGAGNDTAFGGQGNDILYGEEGNDWLSGDLGNDTLTGGTGADRFLFRPDGGVDWVTDFRAVTGDRIQLAPDVSYTIVTEQGQAVVDLAGGARIVLVGVTVAQMGDWLVVV